MLGYRSHLGHRTDGDPYGVALGLRVGARMGGTIGMILCSVQCRPGPIWSRHGCTPEIAWLSYPPLVSGCPGFLDNDKRWGSVGSGPGRRLCWDIGTGMTGKSSGWRVATCLPTAPLSHTGSGNLAGCRTGPAVLDSHGNDTSSDDWTGEGAGKTRT